jgi:hypothetical protein
MNRSSLPNLPTLGPLLVSIADARTISGLSRTELYRRMAAGKIRAVKGGSRTLIILNSLIDHLQSLPPARFQHAGDERHGQKAHTHFKPRTDGGRP